MPYALIRAGRSESATRMPGATSPSFLMWRDLFDRQALEWLSQMSDVGSFVAMLGLAQGTADARAASIFQLREALSLPDTSSVLKPLSVPWPSPVLKPLPVPTRSPLQRLSMALPLEPLSAVLRFFPALLLLYL